MMATTARVSHPATVRRGFTLMEVLISLGIFAIGMVAVAAIFPAAALLQKQTVNDVGGQQATRSAEAILQGKTLDNAILDPGTPVGLSATPFDPDAFRVFALSEINNGGVPYLDRWPLSNRSFPSVTPDVLARDFYWVPLVRRNDFIPERAAWDVFVFVLKREEDTDYKRDDANAPPTADWANYDDGQVAGPAWLVPGVARVPVTVPSAGGSRFNFDNHQFAATSAGKADQVRVGDQILADNGVIFRVSKADDTGCEVSGAILGDDQTGRLPESIWYGRPAGADKPSPTQELRALSTQIVK